MQNLHDKALIYIQPDSSGSYDDLINEHYNLINIFLDQFEISFIYYPLLLKDDHFSRVMDYNYPYIKEFQQTDISPIYNELAQKLDIEIAGPGLVYKTEYSNRLNFFELPSPEHFNTQEEIILFLTETMENIRNIEEDTMHLMFKMGDAFDGMFESELLEDHIAYSADESFQTEAFELSDELRQQILELHKSGHLKSLIDHLQKLHETSRKLSRLKITVGYKIFLMDYDMKEVRMSPLPKALYLLFLRYPEGIMLKNIRDYRDDLTEIYLNISQRENMDDIRESIDNITDPFNNSINEKCSRIREAFLKVVAEDIAENYFITGKRAEPKVVKLDRELVVFE